MHKALDVAVNCEAVAACGREEINGIICVCAGKENDAHRSLFSTQLLTGTSCAPQRSHEQAHTMQTCWDYHDDKEDEMQIPAQAH